MKMNQLANSRWCGKQFILTSNTDISNNLWRATDKQLNQLRFVSNQFDKRFQIKDRQTVLKKIILTIANESIIAAS